MKAGDLRHRVSLQVSTPVQGASGEMVDSWATTATVWAAVEPLSGRELLLAQQAASSVTHRVRIRARTDVTPRNRFLFGARALAINAVMRQDEVADEMVCLCTERV